MLLYRLDPVSKAENNRAGFGAYLVDGILHLVKVGLAMEVGRHHLCTQDLEHVSRRCQYYTNQKLHNTAR